MPAPLAVSELYKADANKLLTKGGKRRRSISQLQQLGADDPQQLLTSRIQFVFSGIPKQI